VAVAVTVPAAAVTNDLAIAPFFVSVPSNVSVVVGAAGVGDVVVDGPLSHAARARAATAARDTVRTEIRRFLTRSPRQTLS
jgi:hypothetical protein